MTEREAIKALRLEGGLEITGKAVRTMEFFEGLDVAIKALEEIQQYREIGTIENLKLWISLFGLDGFDELASYKKIGTVEECREEKRFKEYFDELYGTGLEVANWHENGSTEPFDNFYDAAIDWSEEE